MPVICYTVISIETQNLMVVYKSMQVLKNKGHAFF